MQPTRNDVLKKDSLGRRRQQRVQGGWAVPLFQGDQLEKQSKCDSHQNAPKTSSTYLAHQVSAAESPFQTAPGGVDADSVGQVSAGTPRQKLSPACSNIQSKMKSEIPRNFSWIEPDLQCGLGYPDRTEHIQYLADHNVGILVNLTQDRTPPTHLFPDMKVIRIGVKDFGPPSLDQIHEFLSIVHQAKHMQKAAAVIRGNQTVWSIFCACFFVEFHGMSVESGIIRVSKDSGVSFTSEMSEAVEKSRDKKTKIPSKFSWVVDGLLCGLALTQDKKDLTYLVNRNVRYLVVLTQDGDPEVDDFSPLVTVNLRLPWTGCPDIEQVVEFLTLVDLAKSENKAVAVQCSDGLGATGTMLACYLVQRQALSAKEAIEKICHLRTGSVGSRSFEVLVAEYETFRRKVPLRFSWIIEKRLCALGFPSEQEHLQYLLDYGVTYLVSLTEEADPDTHKLPELRKIDLKMPDFGCPTLQQVHKFISVMDQASSESTAVAIHCYGGRGRAGTMAACYLVYNEGLTARQALDKVRQLRPGSVETNAQEMIIKTFENTIRKMPDNFSWVVDGLLCTLAFPESRENLQFLLHNNVAYLISLTAEREPPISLCPGLEMVCLKIQDFSPPSIDQVEEFLNILQKAIKKEKAVALHCSQGQGRTGTMIACYLVKFRRLHATEAIERARILRPGSVETREQEKLVIEFEHHLSDIGYFVENC